MRWRGGRTGGNVEDRRGMSPGPAAGGGLGLLILVVIGYFLLSSGSSTSPVSERAQRPVAQEPRTSAPMTSASDEVGAFVDVISANVNDVWSGMLNGYRAPRVVIYGRGTETGCGFGQSAMGPFYCPNDQTV